MTISRIEYPALAIGTAAALTVLAGQNTAVLVCCCLLLAVPGALWVLDRPERWMRAFFCAAVLLPPLPIAWGNAGPHPAAGVAFGGILAGLAYPRWRFRRSGLAAAVLVLTAVIFCSLGFAALYSGPRIALASVARALLFAIAVYVFFFAYCGPSTQRGAFPMVRLLFTLSVVAALFACVDFYYQLPAPGGFSPQFVWLDSGVFRRAQGLFYEASTLGNFCAFFLVMIGVSIVRPPCESPVSLAWMIGGGAVLAAAMVLSYSRASVVNVLVSGGALWLLRKHRVPIWRPLGVLIASVGAACLACYLLFPQLFSAYGFRLWNSLVYSTSSTNGILSGRLDSWRTILKFLSENPWHLIFGVGYKTLPYSDFTGSAVIADNTYLSTIAETGLIGLAALVFFLAAVLRAGYVAAKDADSRKSFFGTWTFCFWCGQAVQMFSGDLLTYWRVLPVYLWVLALAAR
jgi:O-antigen ligase